MCHGMVAPKSNTGSSLALTGHGLFLLLVIFGTCILEAQATGWLSKSKGPTYCPQPPQPENGGYKCHPSPCNDPLTSGSVIEYLCVEGYMLKGDYKYLTCKNGEWNPAMEVSCRLSPGLSCIPLQFENSAPGECDECSKKELRNCINGNVLNVKLTVVYADGEVKCVESSTKDKKKDSPPTIGVPTLSIVASTASSVALILLLVVLFVLLQPKLKSFHHSRRDQGVSGDQVSIMVDGVQVALPSYEEAVYGSTGNCIPPSDSRVQIVLSEGAGQNGAREMQQQDQGARNGLDREDEAPGQSGLCEASGSQRSETVLVHQAATSSWVAGMASSRPVQKELQDSESSDIQSLLSLTSSEEYTDDIPLLKEA